MPDLYWPLDVKGRMRIYTAFARDNERLARQAADDQSKQHFMDKANYWWSLVVELREGA